MSLTINHPIRGHIKIKTFDEEALKSEKKRNSLAKVIAVVRNFIEQVNEKEKYCELTDKETNFRNLAEDWCELADYFAVDGCDDKELLQIAKIGKEVEGFSSITAIPGDALYIETLAVTPPNFALTRSGVGSTLMASACIEGRFRNLVKLNLFSTLSAVSFYRTLGMDELKSDAENNPEFSLNLVQPLPPRLETIVSKLHAPKRRQSGSSEEPPLKRLCTGSISEEAPKR